MAWTSWRSRLRRLPAPVVDAGLAVALAIAVTVAISVSPSQGKDPDALAYGLGLLIAALSLARRRWPLAVLLASAATLQFYNLFDYPGLFSAVPLSVALATAWAAGRRGWALLIALWFGVTPLIFLAVTDLPDDLEARLVSGAVSDLALLAAVLLLGEAVRGRRALDAEHRLLLAERERSERLLLNVLPAPIAARLKQGEEVIADGFPEVTVLFADLVDFTRRSQETTPERVVRVLDDLFSALDQLAERHGLEKIKTVGDAYMAGGRLHPGDRPDLPAAPGPLPVPAAGPGPGQGQGRAGHLVPGRPGRSAALSLGAGDHRELGPEGVGDGGHAAVDEVLGRAGAAAGLGGPADHGVGVGDLEGGRPGRRRRAGDAHDPADLVAVGAAQEGEVEARHVLVAVEGEAEHGRIQRPRRVGVGGDEVVADQRPGHGHHLAADEPAALPEAELGPHRVLDDGHAALVGDVDRLHDDGAAGVGDPPDRGVAVAGGQVDVPPEQGGLRVGVLGQGGHPPAAQQALGVAHRLRWPDLEVPAEQGPVEAHRPLQVGDAEVDPGRGAVRLVLGDEAHRRSSGRGAQPWLPGGRSDHHEYAWSLPPLPDDGGGLPPGHGRAGRAAAVPAADRPREPPRPRLRGPGQRPDGSALESPAALFGAAWRAGRGAELDWVCRAAAFTEAAEAGLG